MTTRMTRRGLVKRTRGIWRWRTDMQYSRDVETWLGHLAALEAAWSDHTAGVGYVWSPEWSGPLSFERAFTGPWQNVRRHVTHEFRQWMEEHGVERVTLRTWVERQREERAREYEEWLDSQPF